MKLSTIIKVGSAIYAAANIAYLGAMVYTDAKKDSGFNEIKEDIEYILEEECAPGFKVAMLKSNFGFEAAKKAYLSNPGYAGVCNGALKKIYIFSNGCRRIAKEMKCSYRDAAMNSAYHECRHSWQFHELAKLGISAEKACEFDNKRKYLDRYMEKDARAYAAARVAGKEYNLTAAQFAAWFKQQMEKEA